MLQSFCFWPPNNATAKIKKEEIPDKDSWSKYEVKIFATTGKPPLYTVILLD